MSISHGEVRTPVGDAPLVPIILILLGAYFGYFGVHYWRDTKTKWPSDPLKAVLQGKGIPAPAPAATVEQTAQTTATAESAAKGTGGDTSGSVSGKGVATDFLKYKGKVKYVWGGASPKGWDCSGAVNYVVCHDLKMAIPGFKGGTFNGSEHGPNVADWIAWTGVSQPLDVKPGDIVAWGPNTHMGVAISATQYISAEDPAQGTGVGSIAGSASLGLPYVLRLKELAQLAGGNPKANINAGKLIAGKFGWSPSQSPTEWDALDQLWDDESGWSNTAKNPGSGAYGIAQALGHGPTNEYPGTSQYKDANPPPAGDSSAAEQIEWGLNYIKDRYGTPQAALDHENSAGWY